MALSLGIDSTDESKRLNDAKCFETPRAFAPSIKIIKALDGSALSKKSGYLPGGEPQAVR